MAKAKRLPSGNWFVRARVSINGKLKERSFTGPDRIDVEYEAKKWQDSCRQTKLAPENKTVKDIIKQYIDMNSNMLSPSTLKEYNRIYNNDLKDLMDVRIFQLDNVMIQTSINNALKTLSPKTVRNRYSLLQHSLKALYPSFVWNVRLPKRTKKQKRMYSNDYVFAILSVVKGTQIEAEVLLGISSMRASEVAGAQWSDIVWSEQRLYINRVKVIGNNNKFVIKDACKTEDSKRSVYLPKYIIKRLEDIKSKSTSKYISTINPNQYWTRLNKILEKHHLEKMSFHELRHMYSSITDYLGFDNQIRMEDGGWSNESIMNGVYRHSISDSRLEAYKRFDDYLDKLA